MDWGAFVGLLLVAAIGVLASMGVRRWGRARLVRLAVDGEKARGVVLGIGWIRLRFGPLDPVGMIDVRFEYCVGPARYRRKMSVPGLLKSHLVPGSAIAVVYDPAWPNRSMPLCLALLYGRSAKVAES